MKKYTFLIALLFVTSTALAQFGGRRGGMQNRNRMAMPQQNQAPTESQKEAMLKKAEERKEEFIGNFIGTLEADDFQKQIITQSLNDYFDKVTEFSKLPFEHSAERKDAFDALKKEHFAELKSLISESDMEKIKGLLDGKFDEKETKKEKRKKRKKKNKDKS